MPTYDPDAQRYFDQATSNGAVAGTTLWKAAVQNLVVWMKSHSLWPTPSTGFDAVYLWTVPDTITGRVNLVFPSQKNLTISGTPTFVAYRSIQGNATDSMLGTGVNLSTFTRYVRDSAHLGAWKLSAPAGANTSWGLNGSAQTLLNVGTTTGSNSSFRTNSASAVVDTALALANMYYATDRTSATENNSYINSVIKSNAFSNTSVAVAAAEAVLFKSNATFSSPEVAEADIGSQMTAQQELDWYTGLRTFLLANSVAGVV